MIAYFSNSIRRLAILFILATLVACQTAPTPVAPVLPATLIRLLPQRCRSHQRTISLRSRYINASRECTDECNSPLQGREPTG